MVTVRMVQSGEFDPGVVAALINDAYTKYAFLSEPRTSAEDLPHEIGLDELILAERDGRLLGTAMVAPSLDAEWPEGEAPDHRHSGVLYFGLAAVSRGEQGSGVGRALVGRAEAVARERGYRQVVLGTLAEMGNDQYYEALG